MRRAMLLILMLCALGGPAPANGGHSIERRVIAGGGGLSEGGGHRLQGTIGQPAAGVSAAARDRAWSGFWEPQPAAPIGAAIFRNGFEG